MELIRVRRSACEGRGTAAAKARNAEGRLGLPRAAFVAHCALLRALGLFEERVPRRGKVTAEARATRHGGYALRDASGAGRKGARRKRALLGIGLTRGREIRYEAHANRLSA